MIRGTYHNHSSWSDGGSTVDAMVQAAQAAGFSEFGISDHFVCHPSRTNVPWTIPQNRLSDYIEDCLQVRQRVQSDTFSFKIGLEVDFFQENIDDVVKTLHSFPLDYLIGSVHFAGDFPIDDSAELWKPLSSQEVDSVWHSYWRHLSLAASSGYFTFIGHPDLPKKFCFYPSYDDTAEAASFLQSLHDAGGAMELNTAGLFKDCREAYPSPRILRMASRLAIPIVISADAHDPRHLLRGVDQAIQLLEANGYQAVPDGINRFESLHTAWSS